MSVQKTGCRRSSASPSRNRRRGPRARELVMLTCYDVLPLSSPDEAGVDMLLIGDTPLGMVIQGRDDHAPVTVEATEYHVNCVAKGSQRALVIADMPFGSFQGTPAALPRRTARA